jgi:hypothetical protein
MDGQQGLTFPRHQTFGSTHTEAMILDKKYQKRDFMTALLYQDFIDLTIQ